MSTMKFDTAAIAELASRLAVLTDDLRSSGALPALSEEQFGTPVLAGRMREFTGKWSDGMHLIVGELDHTTDLLREAAVKYGKTECAVTAAAEPRS